MTKDDNQRLGALRPAQKPTALVAMAITAVHQMSVLKIIGKQSA